MDGHEKTLIDAYNAALRELKALPRGHPRRNRAAAKLLASQRVLKRYRRAQNN